jgi:ATP-dependent DNA helicase PIF1
MAATHKPYCRIDYTNSGPLEFIRGPRYILRSTVEEEPLPTYDEIAIPDEGGPAEEPPRHINRKEVNPDTVNLETIEWNPEQLAAINAFVSGKNIFITGSAGTGKTLVVKMIKHLCEKQGRKCAVTSTTGVAAVLAGGSTIHSWGGLGLGKKPVPKLLQKIRKYQHIRKRWEETDVLIIDEVSMMDPVLFAKIDQIAKNIRRFGSKNSFFNWGGAGGGGGGRDRPFGSLQLVLVGDFCQLGPVAPGKDLLVFQTGAWKKARPETIYLTEIVRQNDPVFQKCLQEIRLGMVTEETDRILRGCLVTNKPIPEDLDIVPTKIYSKNVAVDRENRKELGLLLAEREAEGADIVTYTSIKKIVTEAALADIISSGGLLPPDYADATEPSSQTVPGRGRILNRGINISEEQKGFYMDMIDKNTQVPNELELTEGVQVMLCINLDVSIGLANGSRGVVTRVAENGPFVRFYNGVHIQICPNLWDVPVTHGRQEIYVLKQQIPLRLAWACTCHKSQGATLDIAIARLDKSFFAPGQAYTALSRVRSLDGLYLKAWDPDSVQCDPRVLEFYKKLEENESPPAYTESSEDGEDGGDFMDSIE